MGKTGELYLELKAMGIPPNLYPQMPDEYFEEPMEPRDDCYGTGEVPDSYHDKTGKGDKCKKCNGTGIKRE